MKNEKNEDTKEAIDLTLPHSSNSLVDGTVRRTGPPGPPPKLILGHPQRGS